MNECVSEEKIEVKKTWTYKTLNSEKKLGPRTKKEEFGQKGKANETYGHPKI